MGVFRLANGLLRRGGLQVTRVAPPGTADERRIADLRDRFAEMARADPRPFEIFVEYRDERGDHPEGFQDAECHFLVRHLQRHAVRDIVDIGSYRHLIMGLAAGITVTSVDLRKRSMRPANETAITCDARALSIPSDSAEAVTSLCTLEHVGLGRYGDEWDVEGDVKAFREMVRVLRPGGHLVFSTTIRTGVPQIAFNSHRIYTRDLLDRFLVGLTMCEEGCFSLDRNRWCEPAGVTGEPGRWDVYCGCWEKGDGKAPPDTPSVSRPPI